MKYIYRRICFIISTIILSLALNYGCDGCLISGYAMVMGEIQKQFCKVSNGQMTGKIQDNRITEASGLVASRKNRKVLYSHNDSGGNATVFVLNSHGKSLGAIHLENVDPIDVEDIAIGPSSDVERDYIYFGDIGNNRRTRTQIQIYKFQEPIIDVARTKEITIPASEVIRYNLLYPNEPQDIETLIVDPLSDEVYLVQKNWFGTRAAIYKFVQPKEPGNNFEITLEKVGVGKGWMITAGDISSDGGTVLLRNYLSAWLFTRSKHENLGEILTRKEDCNILLHVEKQGESIAFGNDDQGFYTTSEGKNPPIYYYAFQN